MLLLSFQLIRKSQTLLHNWTRRPSRKTWIDSWQRDTLRGMSGKRSPYWGTCMFALVSKNIKQTEPSLLISFLRDLVFLLRGRKFFMLSRWVAVACGRLIDQLSGPLIDWLIGWFIYPFIFYWSLNWLIVWWVFVFIVCLICCVYILFCSSPQCPRRGCGEAPGETCACSLRGVRGAWTGPLKGGISQLPAVSVEADAKERVAKVPRESLQPTDANLQRKSRLRIDSCWLFLSTLTLTVRPLSCVKIVRDRLML